MKRIFVVPRTAKKPTRTKQPRLSKPSRPNPAGGSGLVLTVKDLKPASYNLIHKLPKNSRQKTLKAILSAAVSFAKETGPDWYERALSHDIRIISQKTVRVAKRPVGDGRRGAAGAGAPAASKAKKAGARRAAARKSAKNQNAEASETAQGAEASEGPI